MWLRDFLPNEIPKVRILTYGYDTKLPGSQSTASIVELSKKFLESVKTIRRQEEVSLSNAYITFNWKCSSARKKGSSYSLDWT